MAPVKPGRFKFDPGSIIQVRRHLGLSQKKLAALLGVPANTLSRWETGATTPDADSLATIYSVAAKHGMSTQFFRKRKKVVKASKEHPRLLVFWDYEHLSRPSFFLSDFLPDANASVRQELDRHFPATSSRRFKAFVQQSTVLIDGHQPIAALQKIGWRVEESEDIIGQSKSDCGHEPENTILVLMTNYSRSEFVDLVGELRSQGVKVYIMSSSRNMGRTPLVEAAGHEHWIKLTGQVWSQVPYWVPTA